MTAMTQSSQVSCVDLKASAAVFRLAWATFQKALKPDVGRMGSGWTKSVIDPQAAIHAQRLRDTVRLVDICLSITAGRRDGGNSLLAMNLKGQALRELGQFSQAIETFEALIVIAKSEGETNFEAQAQKGKDDCAARMSDSRPVAEFEISEHLESRLIEELKRMSESQTWNQDTLHQTEHTNTLPASERCPG